MTESIRIAAFPRGLEVWRIDWLGPIAFPDRTSRSTQPSIRVRLSVVTQRDPLRTLLATPPFANGPEPFVCWVSIGTLMLLRVGDLWSNQTLVASPDHTLEHFAATRVDRSTSAMVKAGSVAGSGFLLPLKEHPWHVRGTQSYCVRVTLSDGRRLVVPCIELIRFYFGSSSALLSRLFVPPFDSGHLFKGVLQNISGLRMELDLADGMPKVSAADVGRIAGNRWARRAASSISASCSRASALGTDAYPQLNFPFEGITDLVADGLWLSGESGPRQTFLVFSLRSCSYPFPFKSLKYRLGELKPRKARSGALAGGILEQQRDSTSPTLKERDPSRNLMRRERRINVNRQFPDLETKRVWTSRQLPLGAANLRAVAAIEEGAVGEPDSDAPLRPIMLSEGAAPGDVPAFLLDVVLGLRALSDTRVTLLTASSADGWTLKHEPSQDSTWQGRRPTKPLRFAAFLLEGNDQHALLVAIDDDDVTVLLTPAPTDGDSNSREMIECAVNRHLSDSILPESSDLLVEVEDLTATPVLIAAWIRAHIDVAIESRAPL